MVRRIQKVRQPNRKLLFSFASFFVSLSCFVIISVAVVNSKSDVIGVTDTNQGTAYLTNTSFEEVVDTSFTDSKGTRVTNYDPLYWKVVEGVAERGTGNVLEENERLVNVLFYRDVGVTPLHGDRLLRIRAQLGSKANISQNYTNLITTGTLVQNISIYPNSDRYLQQLEIRGNPDYAEVYGMQLFSLKFYHDRLDLCVRTGGGDSKHLCGFLKSYQPVPKRRWSQIVVRLAKDESTSLGISQWKLTVVVNGEKLFQSGRTPKEPDVQYISNLKYVFFGDECQGGLTQKCEGYGTIFVDNIDAYFNT